MQRETGLYGDNKTRIFRFLMARPIQRHHDWYYCYSPFYFFEVWYFRVIMHTKASRIAISSRLIFQNFTRFLEYSLLYAEQEGWAAMPCHRSSILTSPFTLRPRRSLIKLFMPLVIRIVEATHFWNKFSRNVAQQVLWEKKRRVWVCIHTCVAMYVC